MDRKTPVYNRFIWAILAIPVVSLLLQLGLAPVYSYRNTGNMVAVSAWYGPTLGNILILLANFVLYAATVVLAYFDWRRLGRVGVVLPFHWAWAFLPVVYIFGRTVIVRKTVPGRTLAPVFYLVALFVVYVAINIVKFAEVASKIPVNT